MQEFKQQIKVVSGMHAVAPFAYSYENHNAARVNAMIATNACCMDGLHVDA
jgi:hypothetical protein